MMEDGGEVAGERVRVSSDEGGRSGAAKASDSGATGLDNPTVPSKSTLHHHHPHALTILRPLGRRRSSQAVPE